MIIEKVYLKNYRNYLDSSISFKKNTLVIGANDVGKTNLIFAMRLLLDKSLSDRDIEPSETDFHISSNGYQADEFSITIYFCEIEEDAILSIFKGHISDCSKTVLRIVAQRSNLDYQLYIGASEDNLESINSRFYLRYINLKYINAQRNLQKFVEKEKKNLLRSSRSELNEQHRDEDKSKIYEISEQLDNVNQSISDLNYVKSSTSLVNDELKKIAHTLSNYEVHLDTGAIQIQQFIDNLKLCASTDGIKMNLGGDGRNNQILLALWKAKSQRDFNTEDEVVFYFIEEPEAHLHPHQQRKLANYLNTELSGQTIITTHSPQVTAQYKPDSIIHIINRGSGSYSASGGCSNCIDEAWDNFGYRMSIIPAEAFFSKAVLLVEGPSEKLLYTELANALRVDLDFYNISILSVDGIQFKVYVNILNAMEIPWIIRTDNDVFKVQTKDNGVEVKKWRLAGINRCLSLIDENEYPHREDETCPMSLFEDGTWKRVVQLINPKNIFLSKVDLEHDLAETLSTQLIEYSKKETIDEAIKYISKKKAIRMREFLSQYHHYLPTLKDDELAKPLLKCLDIVRTEVGLSE